MLLSSSWSVSFYIPIFVSETGARVTQWVRVLDLTAHTSRSPIRRRSVPSFVNYKKGCTQLAAASDKVYQLLAQSRWFSSGTPASSTTKTGRHDIAEILLKVTLKHKKSNQIKSNRFWNHWTNWKKQGRNVQLMVFYFLIWSGLGFLGGLRGSDRMIVGFTTTYAISAFHHWFYEFEFRSGRGVQHYVLKFVSDLRQVSGFLQVLRFPPPMKLTVTINEILLKVALNTIKQTNN